MSVILEALKKAEDERGLAEVPTVSRVQLEAVENGRRVLPWAVIVPLLVSGAAGLWIWSDLSARIGGFLPDVGWKAKTVASVTSDRPLSASRPPDVGDDSVTVPATHATVGSVGAVAPIKEAPALKTPTVVTRNPPGARAAATAPQETSLALRSSGRIPDGASASNVRSRPVPIVSAPMEPSDPPVVAARPDPISVPAKIEMSPTPQLQGTTSRLRQAVARLSLNGVIYSDVPGERKVYIGGRVYVEGELVEGIFRVEEIRPEGAALSDQQERAFLRLAHKRF